MQAKEESDVHSEQPEVVLGPAPIPAVNAWFRQSAQRECRNLLLLDLWFSKGRMYIIW